MINIIVTGGGTLGHIYPAKMIIEEILSNYKDIKIFYIGKKNSLEEQVISEIKEVVFIEQDIEGLKKNIFKNFKVILKFLKSCKYMKKFLLENNIELVIGTGGYITSSALYQASKMNIKTVIHEQNAIMGKTNKFLSKKVDLVVTSFDSPDIQKKSNFLNLGNPRMDVKLQTNNFINSKKKKSILIVGGSLGARKINEIAVELFEEYKGNKALEFILITGNRYYKDYKRYNNLYNNVKVIEKSDDFIKLLNECDVIITRSGATTLSEIVALKKPAILIPSPNVSNNHQEYNASFLKNKNACKVILEKDLSIEILKEHVKNLLTKKEEYENIQKNLEKFIKKNVSQNIVKESFKLVKE